MWPKSAVLADQMLVPSLMRAKQVVLLMHWTLVSTKAPAGTPAWVQLSPPSWVVSTMPAPGTPPVEPTAMQSSTVGQEMPPSSGAALRPVDWADHTAPPFRVAAITVAVAAVVVVASGPSTPTAQQCVASAQETAPSSPVPAGAGWPRTAAVVDCSPSTRVVTAGGVCVTRAHDDSRPAANTIATTAAEAGCGQARWGCMEGGGDTAMRH